MLEWLQELVERLTAWVIECEVHPATFRHIYKGPSTYLDGSPIKQKMDVGVMAYQQAGQGKTHNPKPNWAQMLVTGELKSNPIEDRQQLCGSSAFRHSRPEFRAGVHPL